MRAWQPMHRSGLVVSVSICRVDIATRAVIVVEVERIADSCGYGVPLMSYERSRPHADLWAAKKLRVGGPDALLDYQREKNSRSIDDLPAVELPIRVPE